MKELKDNKDKAKEEYKEENKDMNKQPVMQLIPNVNFFMPKPTHSPLQLPSHEPSFSYSQEKNTEQNFDRPIRKLIHNIIEISQDNIDSVFMNWGAQRGSFSRIFMESFNAPVRGDSFAVLEEAIGSFSFPSSLKLVSEHDPPPQQMCIQQKTDDRKLSDK